MFTELNQGRIYRGHMGKNDQRFGRVFTTGCPSWNKPHAWAAISNSSKYYIMAGTQLIQLYKFVQIPTQNININLRCKPHFSRLLWHWKSQWCYSTIRLCSVCVCSSMASSARQWRPCFRSVWCSQSFAISHRNAIKSYFICAHVRVYVWHTIYYMTFFKVTIYEGYLAATFFQGGGKGSLCLACRWSNICFNCNQWSNKTATDGCTRWWSNLVMQKQDPHGQAWVYQP